MFGLIFDFYVTSYYLHVMFSYIMYYNLADSGQYSKL